MKRLLDYIRGNKPEKLVDYSKANFLEWHREREKHLQMIEMLKEENANLKFNCDYWRNAALEDARRHK